MLKMFKKKNQLILCNVDTCKYCDCKNKLCLLPEIDIKYQKDKEGSSQLENTICGSYKCR